MHFTYSANLLCAFVGLRLPRCACAVSGAESVNVERARDGALAVARERGWLQIGDDLWCPECIARRQEGEGIRKARFGRWMPLDGVQVRFTRPMAGRPGDQASARESARMGLLVLGKTYTIRLVNIVSDGTVLVSFDSSPGMFFNVEMFDPVKEES